MFFLGTKVEPPFGHEHSLAHRIEESFLALKSALHVVTIDLHQGDDAQVIFETLNARGEPLLPADLLRNYIFLRAARLGEKAEDLYRDYWSRFDDQFWRVEVKQGRLFRPRSDLFLQHFLSSRQGTDIPVKHLFAEYKFWVERVKPFASVRDELATLARQGDDFRRLIAPMKTDVLYSLLTCIEAFDVRTAYPLLLAMLDARLEDSQISSMAKILESYLLRRAICELTTKNYNRIFLALTKALRKDGFSAENLIRSLGEQRGESAEWPSDAAFGDAWRSLRAYPTLNNAKLTHIFRRLNDSHFNSKMEALSFNAPVTVEHILPQSWIEHWPLPDGRKGLSGLDLFTSEQDDPLVILTRARNLAVQRLGNLTLVTQGLNSAASNGPWSAKREQLKTSLLPINQSLTNLIAWDEESIAARSNDLFRHALALWPRPSLAG